MINSKRSQREVSTKTVEMVPHAVGSEAILVYIEDNGVDSNFEDC